MLAKQSAGAFAFANDNSGEIAESGSSGGGEAHDGSEADSRSESQWAGLVERVQNGDESAMEELYHAFSKGVRFYLCRQLGPQELEDKVHDTFVIVVQAIRRHELRDPERLMGFVRTIVRRQVAAYIDEAVHTRKEEIAEIGDSLRDYRRDPEQNVALREKIELMRSILKKLGDRDREILTRFYLHEQTQQTICEEMELTETQFRLMKSRAKARFSEIGKRKIQKNNLMNIFVRATARTAH